MLCLTLVCAQPDSRGVRAGVEYAFMSTTSNKQVALNYSRGREGAPSTVRRVARGVTK